MRYAAAAHRHGALMKAAQELAPRVRDDAGLNDVRDLYLQSRRLNEAIARIPTALSRYSSICSGRSRAMAYPNP